MTAKRKLNLKYVFALPLFYLFWILFVGTFSLHELAIGIFAALLAVVGLTAIDFSYPARFSPTLAELPRRRQMLIPF